VAQPSRGALGRQTQSASGARVAQQRGGGAAVELVLARSEPGRHRVGVDVAGGEDGEQAGKSVIGAAGGGVELEGRESHAAALAAQAEEAVAGGQVVDSLARRDAEDLHGGPDGEQGSEMVGPGGRALHEQGSSPADLGGVRDGGAGQGTALEEGGPEGVYGGVDGGRHASTVPRVKRCQAPRFVSGQADPMRTYASSPSRRPHASAEAAGRRRG